MSSEDSAPTITASNINSEINKLSNKTSETQATNVFNTALQFWIEIDLPTLQKKLDNQGIELKDEQKQSLQNRKNLANKTKEFKKLSDEEKLEQVKLLLKLYQNEIDSLTTKQKKVEAYFFDFYRAIAEAPDPKPLLELSLDAVADSGEASKLKREINHLSEELSKKADYSQLKQRLLHSEQSSAETLSTKLKAKEDELKALMDERQSNWLQKEKLLQQQLDNYKTKIEELKTSKEVTELQLNSQNKQLNSDGDNVTILAELDIVSREAETSKQRLLEVEKRNEDLRRELTISKNNVEYESLKQEFTKKVSELEGENALLIAELDQLRKTIDNLTSDYDNKIETMKREAGQLTTESKKLKEQLQKTSDYHEIKQELQFLRQIEFDDGGEREPGQNEEVDGVLIRRNKALTTELANYRSQHEDLINNINKLQTQLTTASQEIEKLTTLNNKLEDDLSRFDDVTNNNNNKFNDNMSLISGMTRKPGNSSTTNSLTPSTNNNSISNNNNSSNNSNTTNSEEPSSILPIITKQRDRFRDRNHELEDELKKQHTIINDLKRQMNKLRVDNEELYERTRFLAASLTKNNRLTPKANADLESNSYQNSYESKLHPIEQFRIREQERISSRLSPIERIFISITRAILATRTTRMLFFMYCIGLHFMVMMMTIYSTSANTQLIPEVGINDSTGGVAHGEGTGDGTGTGSGIQGGPLI